MELGVSLPTSGPLASPANIVRIAQEAERLGYAAVWTYERLLRPIAELPSRDGGPPHRIPRQYRLVYEPLETLSYVAAVTERVRLGTSVVDALLHPPVVLARRFATLDQFSGGRVIAGVGQGWMPQEFETANVPMARIGAGMDEAVAAMRACWGPDPVEYQGRFYRITPSEVNPKPVQERIPILLGATTPAGARRAGRIADGLNPIAFSAENVPALAATFREAAEAAGRDPAGLSVVVRANVPFSVEPLGDQRPFLGGSPRQIAEDVARLAPAGVDQVLFADMTRHDVDTEVRLLEEIQAAVGSLG
jgi:probable F420-dependent oxidoreductase